MLSQYDSNILQLPTLPGRILVPQVTQLQQNCHVLYTKSSRHSTVMEDYHTQ